MSSIAIIPAANKRNLMLKHEVIDAVAQGLFAVYAVSSVDGTLELLTGDAIMKIPGNPAIPSPNGKNDSFIKRGKKDGKQYFAII